MHRMRFGWLLTTLFMAASALATPVPLESLLATVDADPAVQAAQAEHLASLEDASARRIEAGPHLFMNASTGHYHELNSANLIDNYYSRNVSVGLRFPLLGTLRRQLDSLESARFEAQRKQLQVELRRAERHLALKAAYADWWRAQQENSVCGRLGIGKQANAALGQVRQRRDAGWMRTSEAMSENMMWNDLLARCNAAAGAEDGLKEYLAMLAGRPLPADAQAVSVSLHIDPAPLGEWQEQIARQPAMRSRQATVDENQKLKERSWYSSVDASLSVGYATEDRSGIARQGNNFVAALNFSIPFEIGGHVTATGNAAAARYQAARYRLEAERRQLIADISAILRAQRQAYQALTQQQKMVEVAKLRFAEQKARASLDNEDGLVLRQTAERDYYRAQMESIASWYGLWMQQAALQMFTDDSGQATHLLGRSTISWQPANKPGANAQGPARRPAANRAAAIPVTAGPQAAGKALTIRPVAQAEWIIGTYVWNSHALLDAAQRAQELEALREAGMRRIYVGLDAGQIASMAETKHALGQVITQAKVQGIAVSLLLGDPLWLEPAHRDSLIALIRSLKDLPFAGLHLDLEVEQLGWPVPDSRLALWLDTLRDVQKASPWPIELSSHHRWFEAPRKGAVCVPCQLPKLGVTAVSLMIYTRNTDRSAELVLAAARRWPALKFRLAQSMEPELSPQESWATADDAQIRDTMSKWRESLKPSGIQGVDWQGWADYRRHEARSSSR